MSAASSFDYQVRGRVGFGNLMQIRKEGEAAIAAAGDQVVVDLSGIENGNSAAVALLMAWFRAAEALEKSIRFVGARAEVRNIVELSGLTDVLPMEAAGAARDPETFPAEAGR